MFLQGNQAFLYPVTYATPYAFPRAPFLIGQAIVAVGFVDCFGEEHADRAGLVVSDMRYVHNGSGHWRIHASNPSNGFEYIEGAPRFFRSA